MFAPRAPRAPLALLLALVLAQQPVAAGSSSNPSTLSEDELIARTTAALGILANLEAKASADSEALRRSEADLRRAISETAKPLPAVPKGLDQLDEFSPDGIREAFKLADIYWQAWERRRTLYAGAEEALKSLETLSEGLKPTYEKLFRAINEHRPVLIETQRRIDRRDIKQQSLEIEEDERSIEDWIIASEQLISLRGETIERIEEVLRSVAADRMSFDNISKVAPESARHARRIQIALSALAEAQAIADDQRTRLSKLREEAIPAEVKQVEEEWKARRDSVEKAGREVDTYLTSYRKIGNERQALESPLREDIPKPEGIREVSEARIDVELAVRMVAYREEYISLITRLNQAAIQLQGSIGKTKKLQGMYTRQTARLMATLGVAEQLASDGKLGTWKPSPDVTRAVVWDAWRMDQIDEFERIELGESIAAKFVNVKGLEVEKAKLEAEGAKMTRAEASLQTELSYVDYVTRMQEQADEELLALLADSGEVQIKIGSLGAELDALKSRIDVVLAKCLEIIDAVQSIENPYSRAILRAHAPELISIQNGLKHLEEGNPPPDESDQLTSDKSELIKEGFPEALHDDSKRTAAQLANEESRHLAREQQFSRIFLEYYSSLGKRLAELEASVEERKSLDEQYEAKLDELTREEKLRYAAAREIRRRIAEKSIDSKIAPPRLVEWLGREAIHSISETLRNFRRGNAKFYAKSGYEISRMVKIMEGAEWTKVISRASDERVRLVGRPVALLESALTPIEDLDDVDRKNLEYEARVSEAEDEPFFEGLLERFTPEPDRQRFEDPLQTYFLELSNTRRVVSDLLEAKSAYRDMAAVCIEEQKELKPLRKIFEEIARVRLFDYHSARFAAAVAMFPERRARIEEAFRGKFDRDLAYRLNFEEKNVSLAAGLLFGARARLIAERQISKAADVLLSKVGLEQEIDWYSSQSARIVSMLEVQKSREKYLRELITEKRNEYTAVLESNAIRGFGFTLIIPFLAYVLIRLLRKFTRRFEKKVVGSQGEDLTDRQRRLQTVSNTTTAAITVLVWSITLIYVFARLGLDITPIVASASVLGLALAFGAQALIKDFFYGFFILIENQITIGDVVTLGTVTGTVEKISLRVTVLRDIEGVVHYIPNGTIVQVSNKTQGWSRVVMEVRIAYREDPDRASDILSEMLHDLARDDRWKYAIIEEPVVAGVQMLNESSVDIRIMIKVRPGLQWEVGREARRRIKKRFDEKGIQIPFPQRVVHHVYEGVDGQVEKKKPAAADRGEEIPTEKQ